MVDSFPNGKHKISSLNQFITKVKQTIFRIVEELLESFIQLIEMCDVSGVLWARQAAGGLDKGEWPGGGCNGQRLDPKAQQTLVY